jgi:hypothetical protein
MSPVRVSCVSWKAQDRDPCGIRAFERREHRAQDGGTEAVLGDRLRILDSGDPPSGALGVLEKAYLEQVAHDPVEALLVHGVTLPRAAGSGP